MRLRIVASVLALLTAVAAPLAAQTADPVLTHYLAAQTALAAGNRDAASSALASLAAASTSTTVVSRARAASRDTDLASMRRTFREISMDATQWALPDGVVIFYCADSMESRGAFWLQKSGAAANPYDQGSSCGVETTVGRIAEESSVVGYLDTYGRPNSYSATRLDAPLLDVPLSVTPITRDLIEDKNTLDINDAVRSSSTTTPITGFSFRPNFYIVRGFYVFNYRDGIRTLLDGSAPINANSIETIEVLRGPSSILYGKGEPGGLVNFTSKRPVAVRGGTVGLNFGSHGLMRGDFDGTTPLGASGAGRLIVSGFAADSYRESVESDAFYVNPSVSFRMGPRASVWLASEYVKYNYVPDYGVLVSPGGTIPAYFTRERFMGDGAVAQTKMTGLRFSGEVDVKMRANWDLRVVAGTESMDTSQNTSFQNLVDGGPTGYQGLIPANALVRTRYDESPNRNYQYGRFENVFRFAHGTGGGRVAHQLIAALDYRRDREEMESDVADYDVLSYADGSTTKLLLGFIPFGQGLIYDYHVDSEATQTDYGVALQDLIAIGDRVNVLAGFRFETNYIDASRTGTEQISALAGGPVVRLDSAPPRSKNSSLAPRLGVVVKATPRVSIYSSYLTAFISPVPGMLTRAGDLLEAEHSRQLEAGVKTALRQDLVYFTASIYKTVKDDAFVFFPGYAENAGREESQGVEFELTGALTSELNVVAGYTFTDMEFTEASANLIGKTRPGMPRHALASWVHYQPARFSGVSIGAGVSKIGEVFASYPNTATLPGYTTVDAMVGYERAQWRVQVNAMNLTDSIGYSPSGGFFTGGDPNINPMSALPNAPRRVTAQLSYRFR